MVRTLFIGLSAYSRVGGLQNFNMRVSRNLNSLCEEGIISEPTSFFMDDHPNETPNYSHSIIEGHAGNKFKFIFSCIRKSKSTDVLLIGHLNLLPIAKIIKLIRPKLKAILFVHGDEVWNDVARAKRFYEPWMLHSIDGIASVSHYTARVMAAEFSASESKFTLFPNAVDLPQAPIAANPGLGNVVLTVTRLGPGDRRKNIDQLIRAISILKKKNFDASLDIVGAGSLVDDLKIVAENEGVTDRISFLGRLSNEDLDSAYQRASLFALPSSKEGFGIVYLEAWLRKLPVICGKLGAAHEVVTDGVDGIVVDEHSALELAKAIEVLISNDRLACAMGESGYTKVESLYSNDSAKSNLASLLGVEAKGGGGAALLDAQKMSGMGNPN